jgi:NDP-sugar pyrophosphorylase family protein
MPSRRSERDRPVLLLKEIMKALILAAGRGTRMKDLTDNTPKPMIEVGKRHILTWILGEIHAAGIDHFVVVTGYHANIIEDHFGDGSGHGFRVDYVRQTELNGTAKATLLAREAIGECDFFLSYGDIITDPINYTSLIARFRETGADAIMSVNYVEDPYRGSAILFDEETGRISRMIEKPPQGTVPSHWNSSGLFCFKPDFFDHTVTAPKSARGEYELAGAIQSYIEAEKTFLAHKIEGFWGDIGTPEDLESMNRLLESRQREASPAAGDPVS